MRQNNVLFIATVVKTHILEFHVPYLKMFHDKGYKVYVCARNDFDHKQDCVIPYCDCFIDTPFARNPFDIANIKAYKTLKNLISSVPFSIIHCHTPVGGVLGRIAARNTKTEADVLYTAHGFHFYSGSSIGSWITYYPVELLCSRFTDALITINSEDYKVASQKMHAKKTFLVNGVGIDTDRIINTSINRNELMKSIHINPSDYICITVAELIERKNYKTLIQAFAEANIPNSHYLICGSGTMREELTAFVKNLNLSDKVSFLGYRNDVIQLVKAADVFLFGSYQEGLPVALMEAMAAGTPCIASNIRGNRDLITDSFNGMLVEKANDIHGFSKAIQALYSNPAKAAFFTGNALKTIRSYDITSTMKQMEAIYFHDTEIH